ncbi:MAG: class I SAM-dependent methyltransferase [Dehalococcoidia bacterium]
MSNETTHEAAAEALAGRLFEATLGAMDLLTVYLGNRLGLYRVLAEGPATAAELAPRAKADPRYVREWLEQQGATGIIDWSGEGDTRVFSLPSGHADVLINEQSLAYMAPIARFVVALGRTMDQVADAFTTGAGVDWSVFGADAIEAQAAFNRPMFQHQLAQEYIPKVPALHARLQEPGARMADIGAGGGWSSIAMATAYPNLRVDGFDIDPSSVELAMRNAAKAGVGDRVRFHCMDAALAPGAGSYDLVTAFECIHDMPDPVGVLRSMKRLGAPRAAWLVMDENVADHYSPEAGPIERLMYGFSVLCCLPAGRVQTPSAATGTVMRAGTFRAYATDAGFGSVEVLPIEHDMFRFYRLAL